MVKVSQRALSLFMRQRICSHCRNAVTLQSPVETSFPPPKMKAWQFSDYSGPYSAILQHDVRVPPISSPSQVLVKVIAASVNPLDSMMSRGYGQTLFDGIKCAKVSCGEHQRMSPFPLVVGRDFSGEVVDIGMGVQDFNCGDQVWGAIWPWDGGSHQEYLAVDASCVSHSPTEVSHIERASIPYAALTAWAALTGPARLGPDAAANKRILVLGGAGGVGVMAVQLLSLWGAEVIATASAEDAEMVRDLGAKVVLDYSSPTLWNEFRELSRFDVVLDVAGIGQNSTVLKYQQLVHNGGAVVTLSSPALQNANQFGLLGGALSSLGHILSQNVNTFKDLKTTRWGFFRPNQSALKSLCKLVSAGELKPVVGKVFGFGQVMEAYAADKNKDEMEEEEESSSFLTGVIEGFYNRPWKVEQRLDLFHKLSKYRLNSYLYAPKDDLKHRSQWRQLYTKDECKALKQLIDCCKENNVQFFYGISPGLDIRSSDKTEMQRLHEKTKQIQDLGCEGFAILWDDIEPHLCVQDAKTFPTFSHAHCTISNQLYNLLNKPKFLFCPIEYCSTRAVPNVKESEYLATLGRQLDNNILVFWTGSKVVSRTIAAKEVNELREVIKRKPVLWDNLHANDYDHQRVFLGPYTGRDTNPGTYLSGVMTNPNCEYSLNIPAIVTLSEWVHNKSWDCSGLQAHNLAIKEFLLSTAISTYGQVTVRETATVLSEDDVDLVCQMFWLPHSHGPIVNKLLEDLQFCKENVAVMYTEGKRIKGELPDAVKKWLDRYSSVRDIVETFGNICDKATHIANRDLLYDLSPYITNINMMLHGWNSYLKWVCVHNCKKPLQGGPTLCGLPGGLAGDLMRLYPVQAQEEYPLQAPVGSSRNILLVLPYSLESMGMKAGKLDNQMKYFEPIFKMAKQSFVFKRKNNTESEVVGFFVVWETNKLKSKEFRDKCIVDFSAINGGIVQKFPVFVKLFINDRIIDTFILGQLMESVVNSSDEGVITSVDCNAEQFNLKCFQSFGFQDLHCKTANDLIWLGKPNMK